MDFVLNYIMAILLALLGCGIWFMLDYYADKEWASTDKVWILMRFLLSMVAGFFFLALSGYSLEPFCNWFLIPIRMIEVVAAGYIAPALVEQVLKGRQGNSEDTDGD